MGIEDSGFRIQRPRPLLVFSFVLLAGAGLPLREEVRGQESRSGEAPQATALKDHESQTKNQKSEINDPKSKIANDPSLDQLGYYDNSPMKPSEFTGSIDPGGYSAQGHADRTGRLFQGALQLRNNGSTDSLKRAATPPRPTDPNLAAMEQKLRQAATADPQSFEINHNLGEFYIHTGKLSAAIPYLEKAYHVNPSHYVNAYDLSLAYLETQQSVAARKQVRSMIARQDTAELHNLLGEIEEQLGNSIEAVNEYERAAHMEPSEKNIFDWGVELLLHQTLDPAAEVFQKGIERYPRSTKLWIGLGVARYSRGLYDEAITSFSRAADLEPSDPRPYIFLSQMYNISSAQAEAVTERLRRFAALQPDNPQALYHYALSLWKGKRAEDASADLGKVESLLKRAAALDPKFAEAHLQLGILYAGRREYAEAIQEYERAIKLKPNLTDAHYRLAQAYVRAGKKDRAQAEFDLYEQLHKEQVADAEKHRSEIRQFVINLQESSK